jgi:hypothetical protein
MWTILRTIFYIFLIVRCDEVEPGQDTAEIVVDHGNEIAENGHSDPGRQCLNQLEVDACTDTEFKNFDVSFRNEFDRTLSLYWLNQDSYPQLIELGVAPNTQITLRTWTGHRFLFTRPGSLIMIGQPFVMNNCQSTYVLPADAVDNSAIGGMSLLILSAI